MDILLLENGGNILLEDGGYILLESSTSSKWINQSKNSVSVLNPNKSGAGWMYEEQEINYEMPNLYYNYFGGIINFTNAEKHISNITNQIKN